MHLNTFVDFSWLNPLAFDELESCSTVHGATKALTVRTPAPRAPPAYQCLQPG